MEHKRKIIGLAVIALFAIIVIHTAVAEDLIHVCLKNGESIPVTSTTNYTCILRSGTGMCQTCANASFWYRMDSGCLGLPCTYLNQTVISQSLSLTVHWPFANNDFVNKQNFLLDISTNMISSISLLDNVAGTEKLLCANCAAYGSSYTFPRGLNNITIRAVSGINVKESSIQFTVDNLKPVITKTLPESNGFAVNSFSVSYSEDYVKNVILNYGVEGNYKAVSGTCLSGVQSCNFTVDLSEFNNQQISYWFEIDDLAGNTMQSNPLRVYVDTTAPVINSFTTNVTGAYVNFSINLTEAYLNKIEYLDYNDSKQTWKTLCSSLKNSICTTKVSFKDGLHNLAIRISDKAGYTLTQNVSAFTDGTKPVIAKTLPASGSYTNGTFIVTYTEANLQSVILTYGIKGSYTSVIIPGCISGKLQNCSVMPGLSGLENKKIDYWFTLNDIGFNSVNSSKATVTIDTIPPAMTSISAATGKGYATINATVIDSNFYKLEYLDSFDLVPKWKTLCSSLKNNVCSTKLYLKTGIHNISLRASDKAGNSALGNVIFSLS